MKSLKVQVRKMRTVWIKHKLVLLLVCVLIMSWISFSTLNLQLHQKASYRIITQNPLRIQDRGVIVPAHNNNNNARSYSPTVVEKIKHIAKFIQTAKKHVRGSKTSDSLKQALETMDSVLVELGVNPETLYSRPINKPKNVCPEKYMGTTFGYPFFYKGFETTNCTHGIPIWKLVTLIKHITIPQQNFDSSIEEIKTFLSSIYKTYSNFKVILSVDNVKLMENIQGTYPLLSVIDSNGVTEGAALNMIVNKVTTPYVFVARNAQLFTNDSRLDRLIREIEIIGVQVAGAAIRDPDGHWKKGCFQAVYRNATLKYLEGYDESLHECLFCDYISGPFVSSKAYLQSKTFEDLNAADGLYEEWFLRISQQSDESIICPDSMYHVKSLHTDLYGELKLFMRKWNLFKIVTPNGITIQRSCANELTRKPGSKALPPCSGQFNADAVKAVLKSCEEAGIICELQEGTAYLGR
ncbi:uncharacterized protein LOC132721250 isoform X3 [Ruditapes philippinarum]|uniref:uncharacterized protein LOC132721250 isoform X2 n=1 Tax=Ruditapes philippinarum TaxID=129788 RepID=UPI00295C0CF3|nr:uncharacterized protein LOC132721250 isoform X2 [Ruditapes philippinarum]XP_060561513.1 uncharacterized protein LOC132721250 isoform X3 [Ruditapes philippinarum]